MTDLIDTTEMYLRTILELEEENIVALRARIGGRRGDGRRQQSGCDESNETSVQHPVASLSAHADGSRAGPCLA